jgi:AraC-like DNA-binding protein
MIIDFLLFTALTIVILTIIVMLLKVKIYNWYLVFLLCFNFFGVFLNLTTYLLIRHSLLIGYVDFFIGAIFFVSNISVLFIYICIKALIKNEKNFKKSDLWHLVPVTLLLGMTVFFGKQDIFDANFRNLFFNTKPLSVIEQSNLLFNPIIWIRFSYLSIYLFCAWKLVFQFFRHTINGQQFNSMKLLIFFFLGTRTLIFFSFMGILISLKLDHYFIGYILWILIAVLVLILSVFLFLNPDILYNISRINVQKIEKPTLGEKRLNEIYDSITSLIVAQKLYLDSSFNIASLSATSEFSIANIRDVIVEKGFDNFSSYNNSFRIAYAMELIRSNYLASHSIDSLCKKSGFNAEVTFYRAFKKINACTPNEYWAKCSASIFED